jgi:hypothetical protein
MSGALEILCTPEKQSGLRIAQDDRARKKLNGYWPNDRECVKAAFEEEIAKEQMQGKAVAEALLAPIIFQLRQAIDKAKTRDECLVALANALEDLKNLRNTV